MLAQAVNKTWAQLLHPTFRKVFILSVIAALITLIVLNYTAYSFWPDGLVTGWDWIDNAIAGSKWLSSLVFAPIMIIVSYFMFPPISTAVMGLLSDQVVDAVEDDYYPHEKASRNAKILENFLGALKLAVAVILLNLLALIPYLILLLITGGIGTLVLYLLLNGYLLGREYFEMVAIRHMSHKDAVKFRKFHHSKVLMAGMLIAGLFLIPVVNILAPILGASIMTHIFHFSLEEDA